MILTVIKIGNSAGVILPQPIREENDIHIGDSVTVSAASQKGTLVISKVEKPKKTGITAKFAQMVDEFMTEHKDVLAELSKR